MPIFCGTPLGRQSPYSVYKFPSAAQVGIHESQPWVDVICFISDLASQVMGPTTAAATAASSAGVASTVSLQAITEPPIMISRPGSAGWRGLSNVLGMKAIHSEAGGWAGNVRRHFSK